MSASFITSRAIAHKDPLSMGFPKQEHWSGLSFLLQGIFLTRDWTYGWRRLESFWDCKEIKSVNRKGNQPWIFIGNIVAAPEAPILWPPDKKFWLIGKDLMLGKIESRRRRGKRAWYDLIASPTQWAWIRSNSER